MSTSVPKLSAPSDPSSGINRSTTGVHVVPSEGVAQENTAASSTHATYIPPSWSLPDLQEHCREAKKTFNEEETKEAWSKLADVVKNYSDETVQKWNSEIDTLLVYAGLFSAILTAFNVQSYLLLTPPTSDPILETLERISAQLNSFTVNQPFVNSTIPGLGSAPPPSTAAPVEKWAVWLNALWFSSLIFSLSAASIGILVKQWLNEYGLGLSGTSRHTARLRQHRLNNLLKWRVEAIVACLPVLLQIASVLFFAGLLVLLWQLNRAVAIVSSILTGLLFLFTIATIILPSIVHGCSYLSPASVAVFNYARRPIEMVATPVLRPLARLVWRASYLRCSYLPQSFRVVSRRLSKSIDSFIALTGLTWNARERIKVEETGDELDTSTIAMTYTTTLDVSYIDIAAPCISNLPDRHAFECYARIDEENVRLQGGRNVDESHWTYRTPACFVERFMLAILNLNDMDVPKDFAHRLPRSQFYFKMCTWWSDPAGANRALSTFAVALNVTPRYDQWWLQGTFKMGVLLNTRHQLRIMRYHHVPLSVTARRHLAVAIDIFIRGFLQDAYTVPEEFFCALDILIQLSIPTQPEEHADPHEADAISIIRTLTRHAFTTFEDTLVMKRWQQYEERYNSLNWLVDIIREQGAECGVLTLRFIDGMNAFLAMRRENPSMPFITDVNKGWIKNCHDYVQARRTRLQAGAQETTSPVMNEAVSSTEPVHSPSDQASRGDELLRDLTTFQHTQAEVSDSIPSVDSIPNLPSAPLTLHVKVSDEAQTSTFAPQINLVPTSNTSSSELSREHVTVSPENGPSVDENATESATETHRLHSIALPATHIPRDDESPHTPSRQLAGAGPDFAPSLPNSHVIAAETIRSPAPTSANDVPAASSELPVRDERLGGQQTTV